MRHASQGRAVSGIPQPPRAVSGVGRRLDDDDPPDGFIQSPGAGSIWVGPQCASCGTAPNWRKGWLTGCHCATRAARSEEDDTTSNTRQDESVTASNTHGSGNSDPLEFPPIPETLDELREGLQDIYTSNRYAEMTHLKFVWELGRWVDTALAMAVAEGWQVADMVRALREDPDVLFPWPYATLRAYRLLGRASWSDIAACGSINKAREWVRAQNRTPSEALALKERKARSRNRDAVYTSRMACAERENDQLTRRNKQVTERLRVLEAGC